MTDKVNHKSNVSNRYNPRSKKMFSYTWSEDNVIVPTPARLIHRSAFRRASKETAAILADASRTAQWQQRFDAQSKYKNFRPYIVGTLLADYKQQIRSEYDAQQTINGKPLAVLLS